MSFTEPSSFPRPTSLIAKALCAASLLARWIGLSLRLLIFWGGFRWCLNFAEQKPLTAKSAKDSQRSPGKAKTKSGHDRTLKDLLHPRIRVSHSAGAGRL